MELPLPKSDTDIYSYDFDKSLNRVAGKGQDSMAVYNIMKNSVTGYSGSLGGLAVDPEGLRIFKGEAYLQIVSSPKLRILINDGTNDRVVIGEF